MNEQQHKNQIDSLAAAIQESLYYLRKISDKSSSETQKAKATIEHCIQFEHCDVEIKINFNVKKKIEANSSSCSESTNDTKSIRATPRHSPLKNKIYVENNISKSSSINAGLIDPKFNSTPIKKSKKEIEKEIFGSDSETEAEKPKKILAEKSKNQDVKKVNSATRRLSSSSESSGVNLSNAKISVHSTQKPKKVKKFNKKFDCDFCYRKYSSKSAKIRHERADHNSELIQREKTGI